MTIQEKYKAIVSKSRPMQGMIFLKNDAMTAQDPDNPVLIQVPEVQFTIKNSPFAKQGYTRYVHQEPVSEPVEAKRAKTKTEE